jgi:hypothetical protein
LLDELERQPLGFREFRTATTSRPSEWATPIRISVRRAYSPRRVRCMANGYRPIYIAQV